MGHLGDPYISRPLINLVPIYLIFGPNLLIVQLFNIILHLTTGILLFYFVKEAFKNTLLSRLSLIIFFTIPIMYVTLNVPSHDIPGLFFLMLCVYLFSKLNKSLNFNKNNFHIIFFSLMLGLCMITTQLSRKYGIIIYYSLILLMILNILKNIEFLLVKKINILIFKKLLFLFVLPLMIYYLGFHIQGKKPATISSSSPMLFSHCDTKNQGKKGGFYMRIADYKKIYFPLIKKVDQKQVNNGKISSELYYNYTDYLQLLIRKSNILYSIGDNTLWTQTKNKGKIIKQFKAGIFVLGKILRVILFFYAIIGSIYLLRKFKLSNNFSIMLIFWFILASIFILIGEVQTYYSYPFYANVSILSAVGFIRLPGLFKSFNNSFINTSKGMTSIFKVYRISLHLMIFIAFIIGFNIFYKTIIKKSDILYKDLRSPTITTLYNDGEIKKNAVVELVPQEKPLKFGMKIPQNSNFIESAWNFNVKPNKYYTIRGFVRENKNRILEMNTMVIVNDLIIIPNEKTYLIKRDLKIQKNNTISYFSSNPIYIDTNFLTIRLVLEVDKDIQIDNKLSNLSATFLEFIQITENKLYDSIPEKYEKKYQTPKNYIKKTNEIYSIGFDDTIWFVPTNDLINFEFNKGSFKGKSSLGSKHLFVISGGANRLNKIPEKKYRYLINPNKEYSFIIDGDFSDSLNIHLWTYIYDEKRLITEKYYYLTHNNKNRIYAIETPPNSKYLRFAFRFSGDGEFEFKNIKIYESEWAENSKNIIAWR